MGCVVSQLNQLVFPLERLIIFMIQLLFYYPIYSNKYIQTNLLLLLLPLQTYKIPKVFDVRYNLMYSYFQFER